MGIAVRYTPYGRQAVALLHARIAEVKRGDPLRPVSVLVPTNYVGVSVRRLLASGCLGALTGGQAGVAGLTLLTLYRLAELLGAARLAAAGRRPVSTPVVAAAVRRALAVHPGRLASVAGHPATEAALVGAHRELSNVSEERLARLAARGARAADVVRIHGLVRTTLASDWYDEADLMDAAGAAVREGSPVLPDLGVILLYLPQHLAGGATELLRAVAAVAPVEIIAGLTGVERADADVVRVVRRLGGTGGAASSEPSPPERSTPGSSQPEPIPPVATRVVSVSDADEEVRQAVRTIVDALRDGIPLERMALLYPDPEPYARLAHEHLRAAGIAYNGGAVRPLADRLLGRWLLEVIALADRGYRRQDVLGLVGGAPIRDEQGATVPAERWERASREAGVVRGRADWDGRLRRFAGQQRGAADREEAAVEPRTGLIERWRREADDAEALRRFVLALMQRVERGRACRSWTALVGWARALAERYLGDAQRRGRWPEIERVAAEKVDTALDRLTVLDRIEADPTLALFQRTLELELEADLGRVGRFGEGLLVGRVGAALGVDLDLVIVLGLAEGVLPSWRREDSLLPDADRAVIADELPPREQRTHAQHRQLLAALAASARERVLSYPRGDLRRSLERPPSRWLLDSVERLRVAEPAGTRRCLPDQAPWFELVESFAGGVRRAAFPSTRQEYALRSLFDHAAGGRPLTGHPLVAGDPVLRRGAELVCARRSDRFTRFDGNLAALRAGIPSPAATVVAPTRLETWARCPHAYLLEHVLGVQVAENPEELLQISPRDLGELVHGVLEEWLAEELAAGVPDPSAPWPPAARARLREIGERWCDNYGAMGLTGHPVLWGRDRRRILFDLDRFCDRDDRRRAASGARPVAVELGFGLAPAAHGPIEIDLGDDRRVRFRGKLDRLDVASGGLLVTDYKTGGDSAYKRLSDQDPDLRGTRLQLPVYALAARAYLGVPDAPVRAEYWFITTKGDFKAVSYDLSTEVLGRFAAVLRSVVRGVEDGVFPAHPAEPGWTAFVECPFCDSDGLGTADRWRDWERKRLDPALAGYVALAEPEVLDGEPGDEAA
jgi:hypothetical protein